MEQDRLHFRLYEEGVKISKLEIIKKAARLSGLTLSEFCRMAAVKEARRTIFKHREDRIKIAEKILRLKEDMEKKNK
jgi:uncharacterized protein (DUF1778 family)